MPFLICLIRLGSRTHCWSWVVIEMCLVTGMLSRNGLLPGRSVLDLIIAIYTICHNIRTALHYLSKHAFPPLKVCCRFWHQTVSSRFFNSCKSLGGDLFFQHIPEMLIWIKIWRIQRPSQHLKLLVVFLKPFLNSTYQATFLHCSCGPVLMLVPIVGTFGCGHWSACEP